MARSVADAALVLSVIAGPDPTDNYTLAQPATIPDYTTALNPNALRGVRLGVPRLFQGSDPNIIAAFNRSIEVIRKLGAIVIDNAEFPDALQLMNSTAETTVLDTDFKVSNRAIGSLMGRRLNVYIDAGPSSQVHFWSRFCAYWSEDAR
jgi:amidase